MSREFKFFIYLLERYAEGRGVTADVMLNRLKANGLLDYAIGMYELYPPTHHSNSSHSRNFVRTVNAGADFFGSLAH